MSSRARAWILLASGAVLMLVSGGLLLAPRASAEFGWYAYAPSTNSVLTPYLRLLDPAHRWAVAVGLVGLVAVSWATGFLAGRRRG